MKKALTNIVFTRNRPLQLHAYLSSFFSCFPEQQIHSCILYKEDRFDAEYRQVFADFPHCRVIREGNFYEDFNALIDNVDTEYINFGTDDVIYFDSVDMDLIWATFERYADSIFGFSLRLQPESLSHSEKHYPIDIDGQRAWGINWKTASDRTASYPFELNGTIYRTEFFRELHAPVAREHPRLKNILFESPLSPVLRRLSSMKNMRAYVSTYRNPNSLEGLCWRWCRSHKRRLPDVLFFQKLCATAIQVNIVNTEVDNPIDGGNEHSVETLNRQFREGIRFDIAALKSHPPTGSHAGKECFFTLQTGSPMNRGKR